MGGENEPGDIWMIGFQGTSDFNSVIHKYAYAWYHLYGSIFTACLIFVQTQ